MTQRSRHPMPVVAVLPNAIAHARLSSPYRKHAPRGESARNCQCVVADGNRRDRRRRCLIAGTVAQTQTKLRGSCERTSSGPVSTDASKDPIYCLQSVLESRSQLALASQGVSIYRPRPAATHRAVRCCAASRAATPARAGRAHCDTPADRSRRGCAACRRTTRRARPAAPPP